MELKKIYSLCHEILCGRTVQKIEKYIANHEDAQLLVQIYLSYLSPVPENFCYVWKQKHLSVKGFQMMTFIIIQYSEASSMESVCFPIINLTVTHLYQKTLVKLCNLREACIKIGRFEILMYATTLASALFFRFGH